MEQSLLDLEASNDITEDIIDFSVLFTTLESIITVEEPVANSDNITNNLAILTRCILIYGRSSEVLHQTKT